MIKKNGKQTRVTRAAVAERAGISQTTVAYVLNDTAGVKIREETRTKVIKAAKELGYKPSFTARSMKRGKTELVGILTPAPTSQFHPFYSQMLHGIYEAAAESDYHFLTLTSDSQAKYRRCLSQGYLDGVILIQSDTKMEPLQDVLGNGLPAVTLNIEHSLKTPQVSMDYESAMKQAVDTLLEQGARQLLFVHGAWENQPIQRYRKAFEARGRLNTEALRFEQLGIDRYQLEPEQITQLLNEGWDGLIVDGYELARDVAHHADFRNRSEPISMVAFSESPTPAPLGDRVTILQSQPQESGRIAWLQLLSLLKGTPPLQSIHHIAFKNLNPPIT